MEDTTETRGEGAGQDPSNEKGEEMDLDGEHSTGTTRTRARRRGGRPRPEWKLQVPLGTDEEVERWANKDMADVYENALRTLQRLQGEDDMDSETGSEGNALATTVGKAERAGRAAEVVEHM